MIRKIMLCLSTVLLISLSCLASAGSNEGITCVNKGSTVTAVYDKGSNGTTVRTNIKVGNSYKGGKCMGRCGGACGGWAPSAWTKDCLDHDICIVDQNGENGLAIVNVTDLAEPLLVNSYPAPGYHATDVAYEEGTNILAMSVADDLGKGFIRFYDLASDSLNPPFGYNNIVFSEGDLLGQPIDIQWLDGKLHVLLKREKQLYMPLVPSITFYIPFDAIFRD